MCKLSVDMRHVAKAPKVKLHFTFSNLLSRITASLTNPTCWVGLYKVTILMGPLPLCGYRTKHMHTYSSLDSVCQQRPPICIDGSVVHMSCGLHTIHFTAGHYGRVYGPLRGFWVI